MMQLIRSLRQFNRTQDLLLQNCEINPSSTKEMLLNALLVLQAQSQTQHSVDETWIRLVTHYPSSVVLILSSTDKANDDELLKNVLMYALWGRHKKKYGSSLYSDTKTDKQKQEEKRRIVRSVIELLETLSSNAELLFDFVLPGALAVSKAASLISVANHTEARWLQHIVQQQISKLPSAGASAASIAASSEFRRKRTELKAVAKQYKFVHRAVIAAGAEDRSKYHVGSSQNDCCVCATQDTRPLKNAAYLRYKAIDDAFMQDKNSSLHEKSLTELGVYSSEDLKMIVDARARRRLSAAEKQIRRRREPVRPDAAVVKQVRRRVAALVPSAATEASQLQCTIQFI